MKLLVTLDGSPEGEAILSAAVSLAAAAHASVTLLTVVAPGEGMYVLPKREVPWIEGSPTDLVFEISKEPPIPEPVESHGQAMARAFDTGEDYLAEIAAKLKKSGVDAEQKVIVSEDVGDSIIRFAQEEEYDLIAMSTHGRSGVGALVQGSVATSVLRSGVCPVLLVRPVMKR